MSVDTSHQIVAHDDGRRQRWETRQLLNRLPSDERVETSRSNSCSAALLPMPANNSLKQGSERHGPKVGMRDNSKKKNYTRMVLGGSSVTLYGTSIHFTGAEIDAQRVSIASLGWHWVR